MRIIKLLSLSLGLLFALGACSSKSIEEIEERCDTDSISYAADIVPIMTMYCSQDFDSRPDRACHSEAAPDGDWTNYNFLKLVAEDGSLLTYAVNDGAVMPPPTSTGPLTLENCEKEAIRAWVNAGAPDN